MLAILTYDAVALPLVERLLAEGRLPTLAGLRARGDWRRLASLGPTFPAAAHTTLYSGVSAEDHGLHYPFQWCAAEQRIRPMYELPAPIPVWSLLARAGKRSLVVDPYEGRSTGIDGLGVSGWQFHNRVIMRNWSCPAGASRRLQRQFGRAPAADEAFGRQSAGMLRRLARALHAGSPRGADLVCDQLARERFDLVWLTFSTAHLAGHWFWDLARALGDDTDATAELEGTLVEIYTAVDVAAGRILAALPEGTDVMAVSPLGMGANTSRSDLLPGMVEAILASGPRDGASPARGSLWRLRDRVPTSWRARAASALPDSTALALTARLELRGTDWTRTRAFAVPSDTTGQVRLNLRGRERDGIVEPSEAEDILDQLAEGLPTFVEPSGTPSAVEAVKTSEILTGGAAFDQLPDLVVRWNSSLEAGVERTTSQRYGEVVRLGVGTGRTGNHTDDAWALVCPGASELVAGAEPARLEDVAATALAVLGGDPRDTSGEALLEPA